MYAAARNGDFFRVFAYACTPRAAIPGLAILTLGVLTAVFCFFSLETVIEAAVIVRIFMQFLGQIVGLHLLRTTRPDVRAALSHVALSAAQPGGGRGWLFVLAAKFEYLPARARR